MSIWRNNENPLESCTIPHAEYLSCIENEIRWTNEDPQHDVLFDSFERLEFVYAKLLQCQEVLSEIRILVDDMGIEAEENEDAGYWSGKSDAVDRIREVLDKHDA